MEPSESMQTGFWIAAGLVVLFQVFSGWSAGPARMLARIVILLFAIAAGYLGGQTVATAFADRIALPGFVLALVSGVIISLVTFVILSLVAIAVLKRTRDQESGLLKLIYGISGSAVGAVTGVLLVWLMLMALRLVGLVADSRLEVAKQTDNENTARLPQLVTTIARLKASVDTGVVTPTLDLVDVIPEQAYSMIERTAKMLADEQASQQFMKFPGVEELMRQPRIAELAQDREVMQLVNDKAYLKLIVHPKIINLTSDPELAAKLESFPFEEALDYALKESASNKSQTKAPVAPAHSTSP